MIRTYRAFLGLSEGFHRGRNGLSGKQFCSLLSTNSSLDDSESTHFGFKDVPKTEKEKLVGQVFHNVANKYDVMNDLMSGGLHRMWKDHLINKLLPLSVPGYEASHLDVAGGTGDVAFRIAERTKNCNPPVKITVLDINGSMLEVGKQRAIERNLWSPSRDERMSWVEASAEELPFDENSFDSYTISFGIRNCTNIPKVLEEANRVLKPGGRFMCLEFSQVPNPLLRAIYDQYSFRVIPEIGKIVSNDRESYQYLVESIRKFPDQLKFERMIREAGFQNVRHENLTHGTVAIHSGFKSC
mmetsp:Transcript_5976/g.6864  ORF Transcript_5976/g.6864 Transcript_5976/m.6864 type:complete len:299 (-) Transcript_5976:177-1073(-)